MRRLPVMTALVACGALLAPVGVAESAKKSTKPAIKRVTPMRVTVGKTLTIRGANFSTSRKRNTVLFTVGKRQAFAKPSRASRKKLVVKIPASVENLLDASKKRKRHPHQAARGDQPLRQAQQPAPLARGGLALKSGKTAACGKGSDWDGDLLPNSVELKYALNPCKPDTDGDGLSDGWEYWSAKDLNVKAVPYPGKKPFPNPLDKSDANYDFDGDSLTAAVEYKLWKISGSSFDPALAQQRPRDSPLGYSDGTQTSRPVRGARRPGVQDPGPGRPLPRRSDVMRNDGVWSDDERDADADGLNNYVETAGPGTRGLVDGLLRQAGAHVRPGPTPTTAPSPSARSPTSSPTTRTWTATRCWTARTTRTTTTS